jgi:hypothetical protein
LDDKGERNYYQSVTKLFCTTFQYHRLREQHFLTVLAHRYASVDGYHSVTYLLRMAVSAEKFSKKSFVPLSMSAIMIIRLLLLATCCGNASDEVNVEK